MINKYKLEITHLYPKNLNLYGDNGNIIILKKRCEWRNIDVKIKQKNIGDQLTKHSDMYFIGGGQDIDEINICNDLLSFKDTIYKLVEDRKVFLTVCAGLQLFGKYFYDGTGKKIEGLGILDIYTKAPSDSIKDRCIGNKIVVLNEKIIGFSKTYLNTLIGFENHIGQTFLGENTDYLGTVSNGNGNNSTDNYEGIVYKNVYGTYLHGPFLSKNPHFADFLILKALKEKYGNKVRLSKLNDIREIRAHKFIIQNYK